MPNVLEVSIAAGQKGHLSVHKEICGRNDSCGKDLMIEVHMGKLEEFIQKICRILELIVAMLVLLGIILTLFGLFKNYAIFHKLLDNTDTFKQYLDRIFMIVIGIEFLQMLCRPSSDNVIEVIIFLVARHMIVSNTSPYQDFVSVISIVLLCLVRQYLSRNGGERNI